MEVLSCSNMGHFEEPGALQAKSAMGVDYDSPIDCALDVNGQKSHDDREEIPEAESEEACHVFNHSHVTVNVMENEISFENDNEESSLLGSKLYEKDDSIPLWVKWRGKWQAGVKCERADWPLEAVKVKPTNDKKKYIIMFFPHIKNYSWVDTSLVRPINELPEPIVHSSHEVGVQLVKDLTVAHQFIMQKQAVGILDIVDQLNFQALVESAANISAWKEFAMEAPHCKVYPDLGRMLLKLRNMILEKYMDVDWLQHSLSSWVNQCENAHGAESIENLREELVNSILWKEINAAKGIQGSLELASEWKLWKHEVIKLFSTSHPSSSIVGEPEQLSKTIIEPQVSGGSSSLSSPQVSWKRPKLEVRRAEPHTSQVEVKGSHENRLAEVDSEILVGPNSDWREENIVDPDSDSFDIKDAKLKSVSGGVAETMALSTEVKSRKCKAYIESKGRQCVRWANEGDEYCCVHLAARFTGNSVKGAVQPAADSPICGGTTTLGSRCKHRALPGSSYCKKHGPRDNLTESPYVHHLKRKREELVNNSGNSSHTDMILRAEDEQPLEVEPISMRIVTPHNAVSNFGQMTSVHFKEDHNRTETPYCIGLGFHDGVPHCLESPKRHLLYCEKHIPSWLKRARNGKSRIISKEVYMDLLRGCSSQDQKLNLHQACELFYKLFKSILSIRNQVPLGIQFQWALSEASKDSHVATFLMKLVLNEKARIQRIWGFGTNNGNQLPSDSVHPSVAQESDLEGSFEGRFGSEEPADDQAFGEDWIDSHKKEAQWYFRGYACSICLDSFTNRKVLETHVQERHHAQFSDNCMLFRCIPCGSNFGNSEDLWSHVRSSHKDDFRQSTKSVDSSLELGALKITSENTSENSGIVKKYICKFCGLKFDLLPDLGRHHQAAHMGATLPNSRPTKKGFHFYAYRLKSGRLTRPKFKKALGGVPYRLKNKVAAGLKKRLQASNSISAAPGVNPVQNVKDAKSLGRLSESDCLSIAKTLYSRGQKTRARPDNHEVLRIARSSCCKVSLQASLEHKYGIVPERLYLKAAKLCSDHSIQISWHQEGFMCPNGCQQPKDQNLLSALTPLSSERVASRFIPPEDDEVEQWEKDECHIIINSNNLRHNHFQTTIILCDDISFGKESIPVACIIDKNMLDSLHVPTIGFDGQATYLPWESFSYVTKPLLDPSLNVDTQSLQLGCGCSQSVCSPETCDHVYLFNTDYEDAKDVDGKPMTGRFPYDGNGQLVVEDNCVIYECNHLCKCDKECPNRILQNGVQVNLEVYRTLKKGWAVRAAESISRGKFVCEYIGEVLDEKEASKRRERYGLQHCNYFYNVGSSVNKTSQLTEEQISCVIDASKYGNVSRFMNHSCSPNLSSRVVLVESMDYHLAHIGLYATRDIAVGEELTHDYGLELQQGEGSPCLCGSSSCRRRF